jgi:pimeloyl-ACP methyl ester carboxylesterase
MFLARPRGGREESIKRVMKVYEAIGSRGLPKDMDLIRDLAERSWERDHDPRGPGRQLAAILASGDRTEELGRIKAPTLVLHGKADRLVSPTGGRATAKAIPGARLLLVEGMGHDLPVDLYDTFVESIRRTADRASTAD